jgi:hypothetical protein
MKRFFTTMAATAIALAGLGSTAAMAQQYAPYPPPYHHDHGPAYHHWHHGDRFYGAHHFVDWRRFGLPRPPHGYRWLKDGPQFVLVNLDNGFVADVLIR